MESNESSGTKRALQSTSEEEAGTVDDDSSRNTRAVLRKLEEVEAKGGRNSEALDMLRYGALSTLPSNTTPQGKAAKNHIEEFDEVMKADPTNPVLQDAMLRAASLVSTRYMHRTLRDVEVQPNGDSLAGVGALLPMGSNPSRTLFDDDRLREKTPPSPQTSKAAVPNWQENQHRPKKPSRKK